MYTDRKLKKRGKRCRFVYSAIVRKETVWNGALLNCKELLNHNLVFRIPLPTFKLALSVVLLLRLPLFFSIILPINNSNYDLIMYLISIMIIRLLSFSLQIVIYSHIVYNYFLFKVFDLNGDLLWYQFLTEKLGFE